MSFLDQLNPVQREAATAVDGPVMIVAGAGSGKTRVLTYRVAHLIQLGVRPENILSLTFTNKAAGEMKGRIETLVGPGSRGIWMGTFHSMFARILRIEAEHLGYDRSFTIYDKDDALSVVKGVMNSLNVPQQQFSPQAILSRISSAKNAMVSPKEYREKAFDPISDRTANVFEEYVKKLKNFNAMDFDDLLLKPLELFAKHQAILERYRHRFKYILVDEYQDTNRVQYKLINELSRQHKNICVVGDDAQSIYAFRGADIRNILDFEKDYPKCKVFRLEQNYRSTKTILAAADSIIRQNVHQIRKKLWTDNIEGEPVTLTACDDELDEGYKIVSYIEEESHRKKLDLKDFAVLYRTNAQSRAVEDALRRSGIPYFIVGGVAFYRRKEIKDVLAYLRLLSNPNDEESLLRIINFPARAIGDMTVAKLRAHASEEGVTIFDALGAEKLPATITERAAKSVRQFHGLLTKYIRLKSSMSVSELALSLVDELGILKTLKEENTHEATERRENIQELLSALSEFCALKPGAVLEDFLEEVSLVSDLDTADFGRNAVTLMTLHSAKGLEFPVVFVTGLEEGLFPLANSVAEKDELEEERRLFYVGITRAMKKLYLSYAQTRFQYGERSYAVRSRFLDEFDTGLVVSQGTATRRQSAPYRRAAAESGVFATNRRSSVIPQPAATREKFFPDHSPNYEDESQEECVIRVGSKVVHEAFGRGRIVAIDGRGESAKAIVDFESVGKKHLMLKFAHLKAG